jgi:lipopolysaccharide/colanic/teichoic acid biosynthesis glycosyltransferase
MRLGKRCFDLFCTIPGLVVAAPLLALIAALVKLGDGGPVFYRQTRVGLGGRPFRMWKFRTMVVNADKLGTLVTAGGDSRVTRVGQLLRKSKLDELPQLFNVLTGEMSLVGPRPEVQRYVDLYTTDQRRVLDVMPGITDPASIAYRDEEAVLAQAADMERTYVDEVMPEKIRINLAYAERASVAGDFLVVLKTFGRIIR